mgnify:CR=1 FL=1
MGSDRFKNRKGPAQRREGIRTERPVREEAPKLLLSFKDFDSTQVPPGQTFKDWEECGLLSALMETMVAVGEWNIQEALDREYLKIYNKWPQGKTDFKEPPHIAGEVKWGVLRKIGGQKHRVAGYIVDNVFYVVFLDKDHRFYKTKN